MDVMTSRTQHKCEFTPEKKIENSPVRTKKMPPTKIPCPERKSSSSPLPSFQTFNPNRCKGCENVKPNPVGIYFCSLECFPIIQALPSRSEPPPEQNAPKVLQHNLTPQKIPEK